MEKLINNYKLYQNIDEIEHYLKIADSVGQKVIDRGYTEFVIDETKFKSPLQLHHEESFALKKMADATNKAFTQIPEDMASKDKSSLKKMFKELISDINHHDLEKIAWKIDDVRKFLLVRSE